MKKQIKTIDRFSLIIVIMFMLTGCDHADRKTLEQEKQVEEAALANQEETVEIIEDKEQEETNYDGYLSRYLVGTNTVYEVLEESTILKRFEISDTGYIEDILVEDNETLYVLTCEYNDKNSSMVLYMVNSKQDKKELYRAPDSNGYLVWENSNVAVIVENSRTDEKWIVVYDNKGDSCSIDKYNDEKLPISINDEYEDRKIRFESQYKKEYVTEDRENFYYAKKKENEEDQSFGYIWQLNKLTGIEKNIMKIPDNTCRYNTYKVIENDIYFKVHDGKATRWQKHSLTGKGGDIDIDLNAIDSVSDYAAYGRTENIYNSLYDDLGEEYMALSLEKFYFDETLPYGREMNEVLENSFDTTVEPIINDIQKEERQYIENYGQHEVGIYSQTLQDVQAFDEHYVTVGFEYEWYRSYWFLHYTFDMDTGELLTLDNMYHGTEEHYKEVVAKYFVDTYKEEIKEGNEGFTEDMNYQYFYDRLSTNMYVIFGEDGLHVVFNAYDIVQYRDEEFAVIVPYEELGIEL